MKIIEKLKRAANGSSAKKKTMIIAGTVVFIVFAGAALYLSGAAAKFFKPESGMSGVKNGGQQQATTIKKPDRNPDITGFVESISGNEVKILLLDTSKMPQMNRENNAGQQGTGANSGQNNGSVQAGQAGSGNSDSAKEAKAAMIAELKKSSTGEETVTIPVGIQMIKGGFSGGMQKNGQNGSGNNSGNQNRQNSAGGNQDNAPRGEGETEASFSDLQVDAMISIWLNPQVADRKVAQFVSIGR